MLAGDHLKSASDLGLPLVAVGLLYRKGYFRQRLSLEGWQEENYVDTEPAELPLNLVKNDDGTAAHGRGVDSRPPCSRAEFGARMWEELSFISWTQTFLRMRKQTAG